MNDMKDALKAARDALSLIAGTDPIDAALDPQRAVRVAAEALAQADAALAVAVDERALFEAEFPGCAKHRDGDDYEQCDCKAGWQAWTARSRLSAPAAARENIARLAAWLRGLPDADRSIPYWTNGRFKADCNDAADLIADGARAADEPVAWQYAASFWGTKEAIPLALRHLAIPLYAARNQGSPK